MDCLKTLDILNASSIDGLYRLFSIEFTVCLLTPKSSANLPWDRPRSSLYCFTLLRIVHQPPLVYV